MMSGPWFTVVGSALVFCAGAFLVFLVYLVIRATWSLRRGGRCRELAELAAKKYREGDVPSAVSLYLKAEAAWSLNTWNGSRESWLKDLDLLASVGAGLVKTQAREPGTAFADFNATIREMREMLKERHNFGLDGRKMLADVLPRWNASKERLDISRARLREVCNVRNVARR